MKIQRIFHRVRGLSGFVALALLVVSAGCDTLGSGEDTATFTMDPVTFEFEPFDGSDAQDGEVQLTSETNVDLGSALRDFGFNKSEVTAARATRVVLVRRSVGTTNAVEERRVIVAPRDKVFEFLNEAEVELTAPNLSPRMIASKVGGFDSDLAGETVLDTNDRDVASHVKASTVGTRLNLRLDDINDDETYRVEVDVTFQVTGEL